MNRTPRESLSLTSSTPPKEPYEPPREPPPRELPFTPPRCRGAAVPRCRDRF